jgi:hypothetical protein
MKKFDHCPICRTRLKSLGGNSVACPVGEKKESPHDFMFDLGKEKDIDYLWFRVGSLMAVFNFEQELMSLTNLGPPTTGQPLPFFEPVLSDMDALISKLKLYVLMS